MQKDKKTGTVGIILTILALTILVFVTNINVSQFSFVETKLNKLVMPIQNGLTYLKNKIAKNNSFFDDIKNLKNENDILKNENEDLKKQINELELIKAENKTLREYAGVSDEFTNYKTVPAYIIDSDLSNFSEMVIINAGKNEGVRENMAVVCAEGVIGHVISATDKTAKVQLIIDSSSSISAMMSISRDNLIVKGELGEKNKLKATYIGADSNLVLNDEVETSGLGGIYPKGLRIGRLIEIVESSNLTERYAIVEPAVDFSKLETVLVIIN